MKREHARVAVVTGGTTGIGLETARSLLRSGHRVAVFSQSRDHVLAAETSLAQEFGSENIYARTADIADHRAIAAFFAELTALWTPPTILVCNAGISPKGENGAVPFTDVGLSEWNKVISINLTGAMLCCQAVVQGMVEVGFGRIVLVGSVAARGRPKIAGTSYVASKAALSGLARALIEPYSSHGITVNLVAPGRILTSMSGPANSSSNLAALERIPSRRFGKPDEVAALIAFLVAETSGFINGATIDINGGEFVAP